eukprot:7111814-Lingulodinium_polyedra.AAC.1
MDFSEPVIVHLAGGNELFKQGTAIAVGLHDFATQFGKHAASPGQTRAQRALETKQAEEAFER